MIYRCSVLLLLSVACFGLPGCGAESGTTVLDGEVAVDPAVDPAVNDEAAMNAAVSEEDINPSPTN